MSKTYKRIGKEDRKLELRRLKKRERKTEDDLENRSGKGYEGFRLTICDGRKSK